MKRYFTLTLLMLCGLLIMTSLCTAAEGEWTKKANMPTARDSFPTSVVDGKIYAIGGRVPGGLHIATVEEYDPSKDRWTKKADMPTHRDALSASTVDGKIYAIGGLGNGGGWGAIDGATVEVYDAAKDKWVEASDMPTKRYALSASVVNGKIYAIGGSVGHWLNMTILSTVEEYDPVRDKWTKKADMPTARNYLSTCSIDGKIYAIGGFTRTGATVPTTLVEVYDPVTDTWDVKADMPEPRGGFATSVVNGKVYAMGGGMSLNTAFRTVWIYDPARDSWEAGLDMPTTRSFMPVSAVNGKIYVIGGYGLNRNAAHTTVYVFDPGASFAVSPQGKLATTWGRTKSER